MQQGEIIDYYSKAAKVIAQFAKDREVGVALADGRYMKRPDVIAYPRDIVEKAREGAATFHMSVERWKNPMQIGTAKQDELNDLRKGWDLVIDIDAKFKLTHARAAAVVICDYLKGMGIDPTVKFSGSRGFHIGVACEAFPAELDFQKVSSRYPEVPQAIASFLRETLKDRIMQALIAEEGGTAPLKAMLKEGDFSPFSFIDIEKNWGSRHLFRAPYSLHQKTWLVSTPIRLYKLKAFEPDQAKPENVNFDLPFLKNKDGEATELIMQALEWASKNKKDEPIVGVKRKFSISAPVPEEMFPPCMKTILAGMEDGKKRSVFTLASFLHCMNWDWERIEKRVEEWNRANSSPLTDRLLRTQLKWHARQNKDILPANCDSDMFYKSIGACKPDDFCKTVKNPVNYALRKYRNKERAAKQSIKSLRRRY